MTGLIMSLARVEVDKARGFILLLGFSCYNELKKLGFGVVLRSLSPKF